MKSRIDVDSRYFVDFGDKIRSIRYRFDVDIDSFLTGMVYSLGSRKRRGRFYACYGCHAARGVWGMRVVKHSVVVLVVSEDIEQFFLRHPLR
jgi:hypothetical protein